MLHPFVTSMLPKNKPLNISGGIFNIELKFVNVPVEINKVFNILIITENIITYPHRISIFKEASSIDFLITSPMLKVDLVSVMTSLERESFFLFFYF